MAEAAPPPRHRRAGVVSPAMSLSADCRSAAPRNKGLRGAHGLGDK
ncbi:MAG: hypothetical protein LBT53_09835 [Puniceicoccales bacterium]|nr:hypothetical protein [Puniceicoccales bacterium]